MKWVVGIMAVVVALLCYALGSTFDHFEARLDRQDVLYGALYARVDSLAAFVADQEARQGRVEALHGMAPDRK